MPSLFTGTVMRFNDQKKRPSVEDLATEMEKRKKDGTVQRMQKEDGPKKDEKSNA